MSEEKMVQLLDTHWHHGNVEGSFYFGLEASALLPPRAALPLDSGQRGVNHDGRLISIVANLCDVSSRFHLYLRGSETL